MGGGRGSSPPPLAIEKMKTSLLKTISLFHTEIPEILSIIVFFCAIQLAYEILKNFHCDAIIPIVKLFWCVAHKIDDCRKSETFLFWNEPTFLRAELAEIAVMFFLFCPIVQFNLEKNLLRCDATTPVCQIVWYLLLELHFCH